MAFPSSWSSPPIPPPFSPQNLLNPTLPHLCIIYAKPQFFYSCFYYWLYQWMWLISFVVFMPICAKCWQLCFDPYINYGDLYLGHTNGCFTYVFHGVRAAFTGDALLIRGCGRTDFQGGSSDSLYDAVHSQILSLPDDYLLFPAHEYSGRMMTSVGEEKQFNPRFVFYLLLYKISVDGMFS